MKVKALVCQDENLTEPLVLRQDWIYDHAVNLNLQVWVHEQCITLELENCMLLDHGTTHSLNSSKTNHMEEDVVCVKSSMMQKESIVEEQARRRVDLSSSPKNQVATVVSPPHMQTQPFTTTATSNRKTPFDKKAVQSIKQIWVCKGEQPPALPPQIPSRQANQARRRRKKLGQDQSQGIRQVWVPKKLAAGQQRRLEMWVPKKLLHPQQPMFSHMRKVSTKKPQRENKEATKRKG
ncbi:hypothetical protein KP509_26G058700 [Ceratopteris richardii]|nr:hypothetical protein KP509_26G058700 [Ceratopteris richardii]